MSTKRRNGQLSSCEPCRKAKLRCDHATPICGRCVQRGQQGLCLYHPAPMTQPRGTVDKSTLRKKRKREPSLLTEKGITSTNFLQRYRVPPAIHQHQTVEKTGQSEVLPESEPAGLKKSVFSTGFLGPSSFWAAFDEPDESRNTAAATTYPTPTQSSRHTDSPPVTDTMHESTNADADQIECGARILVLLEDLMLYQKLVQHRFTVVEPWVFGQKLVNEAFAALYALRQEWRQGSKLSQSKLLAWSERLFENSAKPITIHQSTTFSDYFFSIAPRWETIGLLFTWVGVASVMIPDDHEILRSEDGTIIDVQKLRFFAADVSEICLGFCDSVGTMSEPLVWLLLQQTILLAEVHGDTDYRPWRKSGDLSTMIFAVGLHRPKEDPSVPLFLLEMRRRVMASCFALDKQLATLLGRPPRIAWQYCDIQYPLDLTYDEVCEISEDQDTLAQKIGPDGWNIDGTINTGTRGRANVMLAMMREKILALSLSPHSDDLMQRASAVCAEHDEMRQNFPAKLQWKPSYSSKNEYYYSENWFLENVNLDFLHNDFMLYSVLIRRTGESKEKLIDAARKILSTLVLLISSRVPSSLNSYRSSWDLCFVGLPCAGVLAQELLQRSRKNRSTSSLHEGGSVVSQHQRPAMSRNTTPPTPFPRSEVIQNLSIFASLLEKALHTRDGNYGIARRGLVAIRNILDRVLSSDDEEAVQHPPTPGALPSTPSIPLHPNQVSSLSAEQQQPFMTDSSIATPIDASNIPAAGTGNTYNSDDGLLSLDFMTWLDNLDWAQESLLNYS